MKIKNFCLLLMSLLLFSCEVSRDWELDQLDNPLLVVEAILTDEDHIQEVRLSQTFNQLNEEPPVIDDADILVRTNGLEFTFVHDEDQPGTYLSTAPFEVIADLSYELQISWDGNTYEAESSLSEVGPIPNIFFVPTDTMGNVRLNNFAPGFNNTEQAMYQVDIDWSHLQDTTETAARLYFYTFNSIHISQLIPPGKEIISFPKGSIVIVKKFGLNDDFADYLRAKAIETEWNGSFFYSTADNPTTNISGDAVGFFSTCAVVSDTLIAE